MKLVSTIDLASCLATQLTFACGAIEWEMIDNNYLLKECQKFKFHIINGC